MRSWTLALASAVVATACTTSPDVTVSTERDPLPAPTMVAEENTSGDDATAPAQTSETEAVTTSPSASASTPSPSSESTGASGSSADSTDGTEPATGSTASEDTNSTTSAAAPSSTTTTTAPSDGRLVGSYEVEVVTTLGHDPDAYTQGLEYHEGRLLESTGGQGSSSRRWLDLSTGELAQIESIGSGLFAEGVTVVGNQAYQLTYTSGIAIVFDLDTLEEQGVFRYDGEGWGLCHNGSELAMTDGSNVLAFRDPADFSIVRQVEVELNGNPVAGLNELECVNDQVLANVYGLDQIVAIDAASGEVEAVINAGSLRPIGAPIDDFNYVLNGIAHHPERGTYYLTGKWWPVLYEVRLVAA